MQSAIRNAFIAVIAAFATLLTVASPALAGMPSTSRIGSRGSAAVVDMSTGKTLLSRSGNTKRIPASVMKLFTVGTSLKLLSPDWTPRTRVVATGSAAGGIWTGNVYLVGGGDPTLGTVNLTRLAQLAAKTLGVTKIDGSVIADSSAFDGALGGARTGATVDFDIGGKIGALTVNRGQGDPPALYAASVFRQALKNAGVTTTGALKSGQAPQNSTQVATLLGPKLSQLAFSTLRPSDNFYAEIMQKVLRSRDGVESTCRVAAGLTPVADGTVSDASTNCANQAANVGPSTTADSSAFERTVIKSIIRSSPAVADGSGLSRSNRVSAIQVNRWIRSLYLDPKVGPVIGSSLPIAGQSGTLASRMRGTAAAGRCLAKTGTINGVSSLAGWCTTKRSKVLAFAILQNSGNVSSARRFQDRFVAQLAGNN